MKVLMLSPTIPYPPNNGSRIRIAETLKWLSRENDVTVIAFKETGEGFDAPPINEQFAQSIEWVIVPNQRTKFQASLRTLVGFLPYRFNRFHAPEFRQEAARIVKETSFDLTWVHFLNMTQFVEGLPREHLGTMLLDQHNADVLYWKSFLNSGSAMSRTLAWKNIVNLKMSAVRKMSMFDVILSVSSEDALWTRRQLEKSKYTKTIVSPNGVDLDYFTPSSRWSPDMPNNIVFVGSMEVSMNQEAVVWFVEHVFPALHRKTKAKLFIVGRRPPEFIRNLERNHEGISVTGTVPDVRPFYEKAKVVVAPFNKGGGTKLKILEAMAMERPLVATPVGVHGIPVDDRQHLLVREGTGPFSDAVTKILNNDVNVEAMIASAKGFAKARYSWGGILKGTLEQIQGEEHC